MSPRRDTTNEMTSQIDPDAFEDVIGNTQTHDIGKITRRDVRRYARAVEDDNPLFNDVEYTREQGYEDLIIPPNFLSAIIEYGKGAPASELREDGTVPGSHFVEVPEKAIRVGGGQSNKFDRYATAGESFMVTETFTNIYQKEGSSMGMLTFLETTAEYFADGGERVLECEKTTIVADRQ